MRRSRIKGIANIPQRRKTNKPSEDTALSLRNGETENLAEQIEQPTIETAATPTTDAILATIAPVKLEFVPVIKSISNVEHTPIAESLKLPSRRAFIKPTVNIKLLSQKPKIKPPIEKKDANTVLVDVNESSVSNSKPDVEHEKEVLTNVNQPTESIRVGFDNEYPTAPPSPTKIINRARLKVAPRLGQRRPSTTIYGSASESEDETKKNYNKRVRTESACSTVSITNNEPHTDPVSPQKKEFSTIIQRKCKRTEQSRKMAEARRHFLLKFGKKTPDKQKLTMIDLIFYNPTTNPMSQKQKRELESSDEKVRIDEPDNPDPVEEDKRAESEEENDLPAPQIKIGANGEIVIDEKSLIIENAETKKGREELQKSKLIDGDFNTSYGIYKREKRSKDWSKEETLRFYKALNTLGTDFTMMVELFYGRNRRELKMKFKKEERVNRALIDRALTQPVHFDITELREEAKRYQWKMEQCERAKEMQKNDVIIGSNQINYRGKNKSGVKIKKERTASKVKEKRLAMDLYGKLEKGIASVWSSDIEVGISSDEEVPTSIFKPTRSGRIPKQKKEFDNSEIVIRNHLQVETEEQMENNLSELQPGTIMIVYSQTPTGEPTFKVFMVTPGQSKIPISLTSDMINNLTQSGMIPNDLIELNSTITTEKYNETIPASEEYNTDHQEYNVIIPAPQECNIAIPVSQECNITIQGGREDFNMPTLVEENSVYEAIEEVPIYQCL